MPNRNNRMGETRKLPMGGLTDILDEQLDYTEKGSIPKVGDRLRQFLRIPDLASERFPESSTHVRDGDWVVTRVESYSPKSHDCSKREIVVCYCSFDPIISQLEPLGDVSVSVLCVVLLRCLRIGLPPRSQAEPGNVRLALPSPGDTSPPETSSSREIPRLRRHQARRAHRE